MFICVLLVACNSAGNNANQNDYGVVAVHQGSVGDVVIVGATITIKDKYGVVLASDVTNTFSNYNILVYAMRGSYPLTIEAVGGIDLVTNREPAFLLRSIIPDPDSQIVNINSFTTFIVNTAEAMGGFTPENIIEATDVVMSELNFGFDRKLMNDPLFTMVTENRVAFMVKSSEQLGELIRRTQASIIENGGVINEDEVVSVLSADLVDGVLDGKGGQEARGEVALLAKVIAGQIILEALPNELQVNNVDVTAAMDASIQTITPEASPMPNTGQVISTAEMIIQLETAIKIGQHIMPSAALSELLSLTTNLVGVAPAAAASLLPNGAEVLLNGGLDAITMLSAEEITELNFPITQEVNYPPVISGTAPGLIDEGAAYFFEPESSDVNDDQLSYGVANKPSWAEFNIATGALFGTPGFSDAGQFSEISISVSDGKEVVALEPFSITVENVNRPPLISGAALSGIIAETAYEFTPVTIDPDGDMLVFSVVNLPDWSDFNITTGQLSGVPSNSDAGLYQGIVIQVSDGAGIVSLPAFSITVVLNNSAPVISGQPSGVVAEASAYNFIPSASDADGNTLTFSIINRPGWAQFNSNSGQLSGVPGYSDSGAYHNIQISVSDGFDDTWLSTFGIMVTDVNRIPVISGQPSGVVAEASAYNFIPSASDADGNTLTFSIINRPGWAQFNSNSGQLSGVPGYSDSGAYHNIQISVSDGFVDTWLSTFDIMVTNVNRIPAISGIPVTTVEEGALYRFTPLAADADGDPLTFSIINRPIWANFNSVTGELSGSPEGVDVGSYPNIVVSVSDGEQLVSLDSFNLVVSANNTPVTGSATLSWMAPATRVDSSEFLLSEIGGYRIYHGTSSNNLTLLIDLMDPTATQYLVEGLAEGTHYFSVSVYDVVDSESDRSEVRAKTI